MSRWDLSVGLEWLFTEAGPDVAERIRAAAAAGVPEVELWSTRLLDPDDLVAALTATGVTLRTITLDPMVPLTDVARRPELDESMRSSLARARTLGARSLVVQSGPASGDPIADRTAVVGALRAAAPLAEEAGIVLLLENLNTRLDHPGEAIGTAEAALSVVHDVGSPSVRVLLDVYHALMMDEELDAVLRGRGHLIGHVQIADVPGRGEPGTGVVDWAGVLGTLRRSGYTGSIGLECRPSVATIDVVEHARSVLDDDVRQTARCADRLSGSAREGAEDAHRPSTT